MKNKKRLLAVIGLIVIGFLLIAALVLAVIGTETALRLLLAELFCLVVIPAVIYGYQLLLKRKSHK